MSKLQVLILFGLGIIAVLVFLIGGAVFYSSQRENPVDIRSLIPSATSTPTIITGSGDDILTFNTTGGTYVIRSLHDGKGNFIIRPFNKTTGQSMMTIVNCLDDCQNSTIVTFEPGEWLLEIDSDYGRWGLEMEKQ